LNHWKIAFFISLGMFVMLHAPDIIPSAQATRSSKELQKPPIAMQNENAVEVLRVWSVPKGPNQFVIEPLWDDAGYWGIMLVDIARHVAKAHARRYGGEENQALGRIGQLFAVEWQQPTSPAEEVR